MVSLSVVVNNSVRTAVSKAVAVVEVVADSTSVVLMVAVAKAVWVAYDVRERVEVAVMVAVV